MKPPAIVQPAIDIGEAKREGHRLLIALQDAERAEERAESHAEKARDKADRCRLDMGMHLRKMRPRWSTRGPNAKGWGDYIADLGIPQQRAWELLKYAGYVEQVSPDNTDSGENLPSLRDAGIDTKPRKSETAAPTNEAREDAYRREVSASLPPKIEQREKATHELVAFVAEARAKLRSITERNIHLTDVTTSPEDFMRAKQLLIDIVNLCLDELDAAGVLDGKEKRRQLALLKGGLE